MKIKTPSILIKKILWCRDNYYGIGETSRLLKVSRSVAGYWFGGWKRKPKLRYTPENVEMELRKLKTEKFLAENLIFKGRFNEDDPVGEGRRLRTEWIAKYDVSPEQVI